MASSLTACKICTTHSSGRPGQKRMQPQRQAGRVQQAAPRTAVARLPRRPRIATACNLATAHCPHHHLGSVGGPRKRSRPSAASLSASRRPAPQFSPYSIREFGAAVPKPIPAESACAVTRGLGFCLRCQIQASRRPQMAAQLAQTARAGPMAPARPRGRAAAARAVAAPQPHVTRGAAAARRRIATRAEAPQAATVAATQQGAASGAMDDSYNEQMAKQVRRAAAAAWRGPLLALAPARHARA